jgi:hypothetical protein
MAPDAEPRGKSSVGVIALSVMSTTPVTYANLRRRNTSKPHARCRTPYFFPQKQTSAEERSGHSAEKLHFDVVVIQD